MTQPTIHGDGPARPATDAEIKAVLDQYTARDGAVDFHALWLDANAEELKDQISAVVAHINELLRNLVDADYAQRNGIVTDFRTELQHLRTLCGGHLPTLTTLD